MVLLSSLEEKGVIVVMGLEKCLKLNSEGVCNIGGAGKVS